MKVNNQGDMSPEEFEKFQKELMKQIKKMMEHMGFSGAQIMGPFKIDPNTGMPIMPPGMEQMMQQIPAGGPMEERNQPEMSDDIDPITGRPKTKVQLEHEKKNLYGKDIQTDDISDLAIKLNTLESVDDFLKSM